MTDTLEFKIIDPIAKKEEWALYLSNLKISQISCVEIYINKREIVDIFKEIETPFAKKENNPNLAGDYGHREIQYFYEDLTNKIQDNKQNVYLVLCGGCGFEECWSVSVFISQDDNYIYWTDFKNIHRKDWVYPISYQFTKENYYSELQKLKDSLK